MDETLSDIAELRSLGLSPAEALDLLATTEGDYSQGEWARASGVSRQAVNNNVRKAREKIQSYETTQD